jgi:outer membrane protein OmpA-like peptidoglycan-associated protein
MIRDPRLLLAIASLIAATACATRAVRSPEAPGEALVVLLPDPETSYVGRAVVFNDAGRTELAAARESAVVSASGPPGPPTPLAAGDVRGIFGDTLAALPPRARDFTLFFEFDSEELTAESQALAPEILRAVKDSRVPEVLIVGHTDTTGPGAINFALGLRRANRVRAILRDAGLDPTVIDVISHGENEPLIPTRDGIFEARNRRVEITVR